MQEDIKEYNVAVGETVKNDRKSKDLPSYQVEVAGYCPTLRPLTCITWVVNVEHISPVKHEHGRERGETRKKIPH